jgi:peptide/nickel transport system permease protein
MRAYIIGRILLVIPTLLGITLVVFMAVRFLPGDIVDVLSGDFGAASPEVRAKLRERYGLDSNIAGQYVDWLGEVTHGNLGTSLISGRAVSSDLRQRLPVTAELGASALLVSLLVALPVGVLSAVKQNTLPDYATRSLAILAISVPSFWLAQLVLIYAFRWFSWTPPLQYVNFWDDPVSNFKSILVPALILGTGLSGSVMRYTRTMMLETMRQDYVRTAAAKGLPQRTVVWRHAVRNAMLPVITVVGLQVPLVVGGTVILESIFAIPGMGSYLLQSIGSRDYPVVQAIVLVSAFTVITANLVVDLLYGVIDPRVRYS